ncbi:MAG: hypothetical protein KDB09_00105 [Acidimicrobiales bacterium]|nr:hypothetical protein [Acidimicrobiales bacterium]
MTVDHRVDWLTITECFDRHGVEYLIVGGVGAQLHGATRPTSDFDSLPKTSGENLDRLGIALRELGAYLRVEGLTDEEARALPVHLDGATLARMDISTWRTDAGDLDVLTAIPTRDGGRSRYEDLLVRASSVDFGGVPVRVAALEDIIASKEWADRPKDRAALEELRRLAADDS